MVMEPHLRNPNTWHGSVGGKLGGLLYIDFTDDEKLDAAVSRLASDIARMQQRDLSSSGHDQPEPEQERV